MVTRYADESYQVAPYDQMDRQREERELREAVLDAALWHLTGEGAGYRPGAGPEARAATIKELLEEGPEAEAHADRNPLSHPVIRDEEPDPTVFLAPGGEDQEAPQPLRQWSVEIGPYHRCSVLFFGYREDDGAPELITQDYEASEEEED